MNVKEARRLNILSIIDGRFSGSQADFARAAGIDTSYLSKLLKESGESGHKGIGETKARDFEDRLRIPHGSLDVVPLRGGAEREKFTGKRLPSNVSAYEPKATVPLISWVQAGSWGDISVHSPGQEDGGWEVVETDVSVTGDAFALLVSGDSMTSPYPGARSFPDGTIIVVDPGRAAQAGDFVIAKDVEDQRATFKQLVTDGVRWFLKPLNPAYATTEIDDPSLRVIGRVVEFNIKGKI